MEDWSKNIAFGTPEQPVDDTPVMLQPFSMDQQQIPLPEDPIGTAVEQATNQPYIPPIEMPEQPNVTSIPQQAPQQNLMPVPNLPLGQLGALQGMQNTINQGAAAMRGIGQAEAEVARRNVETLDRQQKATQEIFKQHETEMAGLNKHREEMINAIKEQKIDPKHFLSSQSAPQKVATAIGLILGGLSSGLTGKDNPALTFLNHQIDRDIEGQRMEMSRKHNLLGSLEKQIGDTKLAQATARAMLADKYANEMLQNAEKSKDKMAIERAKLAAVQFKAPYEQQLIQANRYSVLRDAAMRGAGEPEMFVQDLVPEKHQAEVLHEIKQAKEMVHLKDQLMQAYDEAQKEATAWNRMGRVGDSPAAIKLKQLLKPTYAKLDGSINVPLMESTEKNVVPSWTDRESQLKGRRQALEQYASTWAPATTAKAYGIDVQKFAGTRKRPSPQFNPRKK